MIFLIMVIFMHILIIILLFYLLLILITILIFILYTLSLSSNYLSKSNVFYTNNYGSSGNINFEQLNESHILFNLVLKKS